ncbi:hypothetical protein C8Q79DRAFT_1114447 [Trametes meyenii]|nr:hypothetical protein C8Q79DRAFT_1114447 [Trametes meyenii]
MPALLLHHGHGHGHGPGDNAHNSSGTSNTSNANTNNSTSINASTSIRPSALRTGYSSAHADSSSDTGTDVDGMERHNAGGVGGDGPGAGKQGAQRGQQQHRRGRSASQPIPPQPIAGPSRTVPEIDFGFMQHQFGGGAGGLPPGPAGYEEDAIARALLAMQQQQQQQAQPQAPAPHAGHPSSSGQQHPGLSQLAGGGGVQIPGLPGNVNPQLTDMFLAMLPYLQAMQMQQQQQQHPHQAGQGPPHHLSQQQQQHSQTPFGSHTGHAQQHDPLGHQQRSLQQQQQHSPFSLHSQQLPPLRPPSQPQHQPQQQGGFGFLHPPPSQMPAHAQDVQMSHSFVGGHFGTLPLPPEPHARESMMPPPPPPPPPPSSSSSSSQALQAATTASNTPSPEAGHGDPTEMEAVASAEDKRRRNTAASARFRIKKKQWTLNLERTISDLSGRVEELEREAAELRRENGWLKEIVMLKSKRFAGVVPDLEPPPSPSSASASGSGAGAGAGATGQGPSGGGGGGSGPEGQGAGSQAGSRVGSRESSTEPVGRRRGGDDGAKGKGKARQRSP